jgi:hypothetical protein
MPRSRRWPDAEWLQQVVNGRPGAFTSSALLKQEQSCRSVHVLACLDTLRGDFYADPSLSRDGVAGQRSAPSCVAEHPVRIAALTRRGARACTGDLAGVVGYRGGMGCSAAMQIRAAA